MSHDFSYERAEEVKEIRKIMRRKNRLIADFVEFTELFPIENYVLSTQEKLLSLLERSVKEMKVDI